VHKGKTYTAVHSAGVPAQMCVVHMLGRWWVGFWVKWIY